MPKKTPGAAAGAPPHWSPNQYRPVQEHTYKFTPNGELRIHVHFPFDWTPRDARPGAVFFFGGGWNSGVIHQFSRHGAYLAGRGMVAACADYRVKTRHQATPADGVADAFSAVRWLRAHARSLGIDPGRIVAGGGSAGGHLAACTALCDGFDTPGEDPAVSPRPNALVLFNPAMHIGPQHAERFGLTEEMVERLSPLRNVSAQAPPSIQFFGSEDRLLEWGRQFAEACRAAGVRAELKVWAGPGHGFFNRDPWFKQTLHAADVFLASLGYLSGEPTFEATS